MEALPQLADLIAAARRAGAEAADALLHRSTALDVKRRLGAVERLERAESHTLGLRVFIGRKSATIAATDPDPAQFAALAERAVAMARAVPEDPFAGLGDCPAAFTGDLDLCDATEPTPQTLLARAAAAEEAALAVRGVTNSEGAEASWQRSEIALLTSQGFAGSFLRTLHSVSVTVLAGSGTATERDYEWGQAVHAADLEDPAAIGRRAGERAVRRLNPRRPTTGRMPIVYDPRVAGSLLGHLAAAINGAAVARGTSFLRAQMGTQVMGKGIEVRDDPHRRRGLRSRPFDGEGMAGAARAVIADGVLCSWLLDWRSARALGLGSTGHAARRPGSAPSPAPTNLWLAPGPLSPAALLGEIAEGLYVTELLGFGVNLVTGDYSRGAAGFMIRGGALAEPVSGLTIAGNLRTMFLYLTPAADLRFCHGIDSPTVRLEGMTVAGK